MEGNIPTSKQDIKEMNIVNARAMSIFETKKELENIYGDLVHLIWLTGKVTCIEYRKSSNGNNIKYVAAEWVYSNGTTKKAATLHIGQVFLGPAPKENTKYFVHCSLNALSKAGGFGMTTTVLAPGKRASMARAIVREKAGLDLNIDVFGSSKSYCSSFASLKISAPRTPNARNACSTADQITNERCHRT